MIIEAVAFQYLPFTETVESNMKMVTISDYLVFTESVVENLFTRQLSSHLIFNDYARVVKTSNVTADNMLSMSEAIEPRVFALEVSELFFMWDEGSQTDKTPLIEDVFEMNDLAVCVAATGAYATFTMVDSATVSGSFSPIVEQTLVMESKAVGYLPDKNWINGDFT